MVEISLYLLLPLLWILFFVQHSGMAASRVKNLIKMKRGTYRMAYNIISTIILGAILLLSLHKDYYFELPVWAVIVGTVLIISGVMIIFLAFKNYDTKSFLGFADEEKSSLKTTGIQRVVRHPLYTGTILIFLGYPLVFTYYTSILNSVMVFIYLPVGIYFEEKKLLTEFKGYKGYRKNTSALFPGIKDLKKLFREF